MNQHVEVALNHIFDGHDVPTIEMQRAIGALMDGQCVEVEIAALLTALRVKGEAVAEIVGAALAMQQRASTISTHRTGLLDTCGTGGDRLHTFNISTATALVVAAAGVPVAKHGNRSVSSSSGSADVLEALGVNVSLSPIEVGRCLDETGIGFCFAPLFHGAMKHAIPVRRQLGFRTIFNLLGPLTNPANATFQLLGANSREIARKLAEALTQLDRRRCLVVCGAGELDEVSLWGETTVFEVASGTVSELRWTSETFGLPSCSAEQLRVSSPDQSAEVIRQILAGNTGPHRDIVVANVAAAMLAAERCDDPREAAALAADAIDSGKARDLLARLVALTSSDQAGAS